jgi:metal-responsive CopG/Arc/MetJ family transcriptional regulator
MQFAGNRAKSKRYMGIVLDKALLVLIDKAAGVTGFSRSEFVRMAMREKLESLSLVSTAIKQETSVSIQR